MVKTRVLNHHTLDDLALNHLTQNQLILNHQMNHLSLNHMTLNLPTLVDLKKVAMWVRPTLKLTDLL